MLGNTHPAQVALASKSVEKRGKPLALCISSMRGGWLANLQGTDMETTHLQGTDMEATHSKEAVLFSLN